LALSPVPSSSNIEGTQSILRALKLIRSVAKHNDRGIKLSKIASETSLHVATTHRILSVLASEGILTCDPKSKCYRLGIELYVLGRIAKQFAIQDQLRSAIEHIANETDDTVFLLIRTGNDVLCIDRVEGKFPIRMMTIDVGVKKPLGIGAGSLALIAFLPDDEFEKVLAANAHRYSLFKKMTVETIRNLGLASRRPGYVVSEELFHEGVTSIGVPLINKQGEIVAAITVSTISQRMPPKRRAGIAQLVQKVATACIAVPGSRKKLSIKLKRLE
jgi:DNA-binding IclR family transcriptional regulator